MVAKASAAPEEATSLSTPSSSTVSWLPTNNALGRTGHQRWGKVKLIAHTTSAFRHTHGIHTDIVILPTGLDLVTRKAIKQPSPLVNSVLMYAHLALFGMAGTYLRIVIDEHSKFFGTSGTSALFLALPVNMLGSFIIGILSPEPGHSSVSMSTVAPYYRPLLYTVRCSGCSSTCPYPTPGDCALPALVELGAGQRSLAEGRTHRLLWSADDFQRLEPSDGGDGA